MAISVIGGSTSSAVKSQQTAIITSTQSWTAPAGVTSVDLFLVAGGGGGGATWANAGVGGGGGGGGIVQGTFAVTPSTAYTVTIGAGGAGASVQGYASGGSNSSFGSLAVAYGGGPGETASLGFPTGTFGSGGGQGWNAANTAAGSGGGAGMPTLGYGYNTDVFYYFNLNTCKAIQGVAGFKVYGAGSNWTLGTNPGIGGFGAGGGGGCGHTTLYTQAGPNAGNGAYFPSNTATAGVANRGGGGGGGSWNASYLAAAAGGSGICIIKYWA